jgi:uncharacterized protein (TIGR00251 family)
LIPFQESDGGVSFAVKVHPRARKNAITGEFGDALKLSLTSPPVDGRANQASIEFLAKLFDGAPIFRYHCLRPDQPPESRSCRGALGRRSAQTDWNITPASGSHT